MTFGRPAGRQEASWPAVWHAGCLHGMGGVPPKSEGEWYGPCYSQERARVGVPPTSGQRRGTIGEGRGAGTVGQGSQEGGSEIGQQSVGHCCADWGAALREVAWGSPVSSCQLAVNSGRWPSWSPTTEAWMTGNFTRSLRARRSKTEHCARQFLAEEETFRALRTKVATD